jgi:hypothetical protein
VLNQLSDIGERAAMLVPVFVFVTVTVVFMIGPRLVALIMMMIVRMVMLVSFTMIMPMLVFMVVLVFAILVVAMRLVAFVTMAVCVVVIFLQVNVKLDPLDMRILATRRVEVIPVQTELLQLLVELLKIDP